PAHGAGRRPSPAGERHRRGVRPVGRPRRPIPAAGAGGRVSIDVLNETEVEVDLDELHECARYTMDAMKVHPQADLCLRVIDESAMELLHVRWMDLPGPTDVMSFPMDELRPGSAEETSEEGVLGDIVLCPTVAQRQ